MEFWENDKDMVQQNYSEDNLSTPNVDWPDIKNRPSLWQACD